MSAFAAYYLPLLVAYAATFGWVWDSWMLSDSYYSHGPLVPLVAADLIWRRRDRLARMPGGPDVRAWLLLAPGLALHLAGAALMVDSLSAASLALTLPGVVWLAAGPRRGWALAPVVVLLLLAVPMPMFMTGRLAFELKEVAMTAAIWLCGVVGLTVERVNADLFVAPQSVPLQVADACGGLRSLIALVTLGYGFAWFVADQRAAGRWLLLLAAVPIAVGTNVLRITAICWVASHYGVAAASGLVHDVLGYGALAVALALLFGLDAGLARALGRAEGGA